MPSAMSLFLIAVLACAAWGYLTLGRGGFWRADQCLGDAPAPAEWPEIAAIIPARDEAETIAAAVEALLASDYRGRLTVIVVDDSSTDGTVDIARRAAERMPKGDDRAFEIAAAADLPEGWSGKMWAVNQGLARALEAAPGARYMLLTDADIVLTPDALRRLTAKAETEGLALASLMARLDARGRWGGLLIPAFIYFFQKLYPFPRANDPYDDMAAAAGGCMLVRAEALEAIGGVAAIREALIDDCALARRIKDISPSTKIWIGLAEREATSLRDNRSLESIWNMVARTAYAQLGLSPLLLAGTVLGMALLYLAPPLVVVTLGWHGDWGAFLFAAIAWGLMAYTYWPTLRLYGREPLETIFLPVAAGLYTAMTVSSAMRYWRGDGAQWKGRRYGTGT